MKAKQGRMKEATSMRLSPEAKRLLAQMSREMGISQGDVVEVSIRALARREGITAGRGPNGASTGPAELSLSERLAALAQEVPDEEFEGRATDYATQHDHYVYGTPKRL